MVPPPRLSRVARRLACVISSFEASFRPGWSAALAAAGLDRLSPPELELAVRELTHDRGAFVSLLTRVSDYPRSSLIEPRRPDAAALERLDRALPPARAVLAPDDAEALCIAATQFEALLVLDPFWFAPELLYREWHSPGVAERHAHALTGMAGPSARLEPLIAAGLLGVVPDHLPGSWTPFPLAGEPRDSDLAVLSQVARLLYWADRMRAVCVLAQPRAIRLLRALIGQVASEMTLELPMADSLDTVLDQRRAHPPDQQRLAAWARLCRSGEGFVPATGASSDAQVPWLLVRGSADLPDVALALRRVHAGRCPNAEPRGRTRLRRRIVYLVPGSADATGRILGGEIGSR